ncbi:2724_t:CDS:1, partial [Scutellospora calospora]
MSTKKSYSKHEIWNNFHDNSDKTKVICNLCDQSYLKSSSSIVINMKNHFKRQHNKEFIETLQK